MRCVPVLLKGNSMRKNGYAILLAFFLAIFAFSGWKAWEYYKETSEQDAFYESLAQIVGEAEATPGQEEVIPPGLSVSDEENMYSGQEMTATLDSPANNGSDLSPAVTANTAENSDSVLFTEWQTVVSAASSENSSADADIEMQATMVQPSSGNTVTDSATQTTMTAPSSENNTVVYPATTAPATDSSSDNGTTMIPEYAQLYARNKDFVGWVSIAGTRVNYPVMQSLSQPNYYLRRDFNKRYTDYGCPYVGENCDMSRPSDNLIIYGHHMKNGAMFSDLEKFKKKSFWEKHKTFSFNTLYEKQTYEIIAVFKTVVYTDSSDEFRYYLFTDAESAEQFDEYITRCKELSLYDTGVSASYGDKLVTLSTCEYSSDNGRLVVVGKRIA